MKEFVGVVVFVLFICAMFYGVTVDGKHYGIKSIDADAGIVIDTGSPRGAVDVDGGAP